MLRKVASILALAALVIVTNAELIPEKIMGGEDADIGEFPYQVSLRFAEEHFCGGALISKRHVLTAGHCVYAADGALSYVTAVVGTNFVFARGNTYKVKALDYHPKYNPDGSDWMYDIGVVTLASDVKLSNRVAIAKLPTKDVAAGEKAVVTGWGSVSGPNSGGSRNIKKLTVNILSHEECQDSMPYFAKPDPSYICTFVEEGAGACEGDSGGPLVKDGEVVGIVSGGINCAIGFPDVFTNVYKYLSYIKEITEK